MANRSYINAASHSVEHPVVNWSRRQTLGLMVEEEKCLKGDHIPLDELSAAQWNGVKAESIEEESLKEGCPPSDLDDESLEVLNERQTWSSSSEEEQVEVRQPTIEQTESPQVKWSVNVKEKLGCREETLGQQRQVMQPSPVEEPTIDKELMSLKQQNSDLIRELRKRKDESRHLHDVTGRLCTAVDKKTNKLQCLSKEMASISSELQREHTLRVQLSDELQRCKNTLLPQISAGSSPKETQGTEIDAKDKDTLTIELQKERNWNLQLSNELKEYGNVLLKKYQTAKSTEVTKAHSQVLEGNPDDAFRISSTLLSEFKRIDSSSKQKTPQTNRQQKAHEWKLPQRDNAEFLSMAETGCLHQMFEDLPNEILKVSDILADKIKKEKNEEYIPAMARNNVTHQNVNYLLHGEKLICDTTQVTSDEEENLKMTHILLNQKLHVQSGIIANLKAEGVQLSHQLEMEMKKKDSLSKIRESDLAQLQQEKEWRIDLIYQLEKQVFDHQQELENLRQSVSETQGLLQELKALKQSKSKLYTRLHRVEELCHHFQAVSLRLTANLQSEKEKKDSLTDELQKKQSSTEQQCLGCQREKETLQEVVEGNSMVKGAKEKRGFFTWRKNKRKRKAESSLCQSD